MIGEFFYKYYIGPILEGEAYTVVDTLTYAAILLLSVYLLYRWLRSHGIPVDSRLVLATIPYVVLGGLLRVVEDTGIIPSPYHALLVTPLIFFVVFFFAVAALLVSRLFEARGVIRDALRGYAMTGTVASIGAAILLVALGIGQFSIAPGVLAVILLMTSGAALAVYAVVYYLFGWTFVAGPLYRLLIFGHMLDAAATSYGIDLHPLSYVEQHVVGSTLIEATGTAFVMFPLKLAVIIPALWVLELYRKEGSAELWNLILLAMITVGLAPGVRDMVRMVLYV
ncbi:MAG: DUF63 family protein [Methanomicrobiaceae archaeon]|nr:DUF63 family protein [Methanomicrobiaceae archaeon]